MIEAPTVPDVTKKAGKPSLPEDEAARVVEAMDWLLKTRFKGNKTALGREMGISQPGVTQLLDGSNKPSPATAARVAELVGVTEWQLRRGEGHDYRSLGEQRYPNRAIAATHARQMGISDQAIREILAEDYQLAEDKPVLWWFELMQDRERHLKRFGDAAPGRPLEDE